MFEAWLQLRRNPLPSRSKAVRKLMSERQSALYHAASTEVVSDEDVQNAAGERAQAIRGHDDSGLCVIGMIKLLKPVRHLKDASKDALIIPITKSVEADVLGLYKRMYPKNRKAARQQVLIAALRGFPRP